MRLHYALWAVAHISLVLCAIPPVYAFVVGASMHESIFNWLYWPAIAGNIVAFVLARYPQQTRRWVRVDVDDLFKVEEVFKSAALFTLIIEREAFSIECSTPESLYGCIDDPSYSDSSLVCPFNAGLHPRLGCSEDQVAIVCACFDDLLQGQWGNVAFVELATIVVAFVFANDVTADASDASRRTKVAQVMLSLTSCLSAVMWSVFLGFNTNNRGLVLNQAILGFFIACQWLIAFLAYISALQDSSATAVAPEAA